VLERRDFSKMAPKLMGRILSSRYKVGSPDDTQRVGRMGFLDEKV